MCLLVLDPLMFLQNKVMPCSLAVFALSCFSFPTQAKEQEYDPLLEISLEDLLNLTVISASGIEEAVKDAPAAMVLLTKKEIEVLKLKRKGFTQVEIAKKLKIKQSSVCIFLSLYIFK